MSKGNVEQNRDLIDSNRINYQSWPDEPENDNKVHIHHGLSGHPQDSRSHNGIKQTQNGLLCLVIIDDNM
jgi:hypothetical protein